MVSPTSSLAASDLDVARLLFDLKLCGELVGRFSGCLEPRAIAACVTDGLVEQFGCVFARIWLVEPDRSGLRLVASSGLYTRLNGSFARVPMGAFKVGRIAEHGIPFLSNCLAEEGWVKDRAWAIENKILGFAGLPLMVESRSIGVLAVFSQEPMAGEFLEVLQILSVSVANALAGAMKHQVLASDRAGRSASLSERLAGLLGAQRLSLLGTERGVPLPVSQLLVKMGERLAALDCHYCRLLYEEDAVVLEAMLAVTALEWERPLADFEDGFEDILADVARLNGECEWSVGENRRVMRVRLCVPLVGESGIGESAMGEATVGESGQKRSPLSGREYEVIELLVQGLRDREIAERLYISERTVKFHVKNMLEKLGVKTRVQGVFEAMKQGWLG